MTEGPRIVVVGAGLAGLNAARLLSHRGARVSVLEQESLPGGRVRSETTAEGFVLDRGFQVFFSAYPALKRAIDIRRLTPRRFDSGAAVVTARGPRFFRPPLHHPEHTLSALSSPLLTYPDRAHLVLLGARLLAERWDGVQDVPDTGRSTIEELKHLGFSDRFINGFIRLFWGGILLQPDLSTSARVFLFTLKMLVQGRAFLPATGAGELPRLLGEGLPASTLRLGTKVDGLLRDGASVTGVSVEGAEMRAEAVVLATDGGAASRLASLKLPEPTLGCTTLYFAGRTRLFNQKLVALNALPERYVNEAALLTNIAPEYAPVGWHLLSATVLNWEDEDAVMEERARRDLQRWFPHVDFTEWRLIGLVRVPRAQFPQPPTVPRSLPRVRLPLRNLYLASEITEDSSINGGLRGGEAAARAVAGDLGLSMPLADR